MKDKRVPRSGVNGFMNWKSCLNNLIALYSEMTGKLDEDTKLRGVADRPDECATIQRDLNNPEERVARSFMKFKKGKGSILPTHSTYWGMMGCNTAWQKMNCRSW